MKRGGYLKRTTRLKKVSARVKRERSAFEAVYREVDARSEGQCEVEFDISRSTRADRLFSRIYTRCTSRATEHHHTRKPRRSAENHTKERVIHLCARHHAMCSASYRSGRLLIDPNGDGTFTCRVEQRASKFSASSSVASARSE